MANIITRQTTGTNATAKNAPLSNAEMDNNLINMNSEVSTLALNANKYAGELSFLYLEMIKAMPGLKGYWPADPAYIYQDSAGYIPATVGGVVGQVRDISQSTVPVARRNLLTYTEQFDNVAWTKENGNVAVTPNAELAPDGSTTADLAVFTGVNSLYKTTSISVASTTKLCLSIWLKGTAAETIGVWLTSLLSNSISTYTLTGEWQRISCSITVDGTVPEVDAGVRSTGSASSVYVWGAQLEVGAEATPYQKIEGGTGDVFAPGNHAYQQTTANKPYLRKTPTSGVHCLVSNTYISALTATLGNLGSSCTVAKAGAEGVTFTEGVTISSTYNIAPAYGFNGDVAIFDRALTVTEKALLTRYMQRGVPVLGSNLVTNGTFDTDTTGWTAANGGILASVGGQLSITNGAADPGSAVMTATTVPNAYYLFSMSKVTPAPLRATMTAGYFSLNNDYGGLTAVAAGDYDIVINPAVATTHLTVRHTDNALNDILLLDNISLKEIL